MSVAFGSNLWNILNVVCVPMSHSMYWAFFERTIWMDEGSPAWRAQITKATSMQHKRKHILYVATHSNQLNRRNISSEAERWICSGPHHPHLGDGSMFVIFSNINSDRKDLYILWTGGLAGSQGMQRSEQFLKRTSRCYVSVSGRRMLLGHPPHRRFESIGVTL